MPQKWVSILEEIKSLSAKDSEQLKGGIIKELRGLKEESLKAGLCVDMSEEQATLFYLTLEKLKEPCIVAELIGKLQNPTQANPLLLKKVSSDGKISDFETRLQAALWGRGVKENVRALKSIIEKHPTELIEVVNNFRNNADKIYRVALKQNASGRVVMELGNLPIEEGLRRSFGKLLALETQIDPVAQIQGRIWSKGHNLNLFSLHQDLQENPEETLAKLKSLPDNLDYEALTAHWRSLRTHKKRRQTKQESIGGTEGTLPSAIRVLVESEEIDDDYKVKTAQTLLKDPLLLPETFNQVKIWSLGIFVTPIDFKHQIKHGDSEGIEALIRADAPFAYKLLEEIEKGSVARLLETEGEGCSEISQTSVKGTPALFRHVHLATKEKIALAKARLADTTLPQKERAIARKTLIINLFQAGAALEAFAALESMDPATRTEYISEGVKIMREQFDGEHHERFAAAFLASGGKLHKDYKAVLEGLAQSRLARRMYSECLDTIVELRRAESGMVEAKSSRLFNDLVMEAAKDKNPAVLPTVAEKMESCFGNNRALKTRVLFELVKHAERFGKTAEVLRYGIRYFEGNPNAEDNPENVARTEGRILSVMEKIQGSADERKVAQWVVGWTQESPETGVLNKVRFWALQNTAEVKVSESLGEGVLTDARIAEVAKLYKTLAKTAPDQSTELGQRLGKIAVSALFKQSASFKNFGEILDGIQKLSSAINDGVEPESESQITEPINAIVRKANEYRNGLLGGFARE